MKKFTKLLVCGLCIASMFALSSCSVIDNVGGNLAGDKVENTNPPSTNLPDTNPPDTNPPSTNPPSTNPPSTNPPSTNPPSTNPPSTNPPSTNPPSTNPPSTNPPSTNPPSTNPPSTNPPDTNPPDTNPPDTNPPDTNPPDTNPPTSTSFFDGNYQVVTLTEIEEFAENTSEDILKEILLNNIGVLSTYKYAVKLSIGEDIRDDRELLSDFKISRAGLNATSAYKAEVKQTTTINSVQSGSFVYDNGTNSYLDTPDGKTKIASKGYEAFAEYLTFNVMSMQDTIEQMSYAYTNAVWSMDSVDEKYTKIRVTFDLDYGSTYTTEKNSATYIWAYNKNNKCVGIYMDMDLIATDTAEERTDVMDAKVVAQPWEGTVTEPTDLDTYLDTTTNDNENVGGGEQETGIFSGNYRQTDVNSIKEFAKNTSDEPILDGITYNDGTIVTLTEGTNGTNENGEKVVTSATNEVQIVRHENSYQFIRTLQGAVVTNGATTRIIQGNSYYDGEYLYEKEIEGDTEEKTKRAVEGVYDAFRGVSGTISLQEIVADLEVYEAQGGFSIDCYMDSTDDTYIKVKINAVSNGSSLEQGEQNIIMVFDKTSYACVAFTVEGVSAVEGEEYRISMIMQPWEGSITLPSDLHTYVEVE